MDKTITAFFDTAEELEAARSAACERGADAGRISVCRAEDKPSFFGANTVGGAFAGAAVGTIVGLGSAALEGMGVVASVGPVAGLITGTVLGAVVGGFLDYGRRGGRERWLFTVSMDESGVGATARELKRHGADKLAVY